eukprot:766545-Hanusia_phi.AAC.2
MRRIRTTRVEPGESCQYPEEEAAEKVREESGGSRAGEKNSRFVSPLVLCNSQVPARGLSDMQDASFDCQMTSVASYDAADGLTEIRESED